MSAPLIMFIIGMVMRYKLSNYIYILTDMDNGILFNGVSKKFLCVKKNELPVCVQLLKRLSNDACDISAKMVSYLQKFEAAGFLLPVDFDERAQILQAERKYIDSTEFQTMLIPTYDCNYSCWYCIQKHHPTTFTDKDVQKIEKHIVSYILQNKISKYSLCWFGGEPLMQRKRVVEMSSFLSTWCTQNNVSFCGQMTTNGALLTRDVAQKLIEGKIYCYQITLDGNREHHDKTKREKKSQSSFDLIVNNISYLMALDEQVVVVLRLNYNNKKLEDLNLVDELDSILPRVCRERIHVDLQKIWQSGDEPADTRKLYKLLEAFARSGYHLSTGGFFQACYVDKRHFETIFYNGKVDYCDNYAVDKARGSIVEDGSVAWETVPKSHSMRGKSSVECETCSYYPVCTGECLAQRDRRLRQNHPFKCPTHMKRDLNLKVLDYCYRNMLNAKYSKK